MQNLSTDDEINLREYWRVLVRQRVFILSIFCTVALLAALVTLLMPNIYEGKTVLIPLGKSPNSLQSTLGALGNLLPLK